MPRVSELSQVEAETQQNRFDEEVPYDDKLVNLLPNEAKVRKMTEQKEERLEGKPELENAIKKILSQQVEQGIIEKVPEDEVAERQRHMVPWYCILRLGHPTSQGQKELLLHEFLVKGDCLPQPSFVQLMNELRRTAMNVVTVEIHSQVFDIDRFSDLDRLLNTIDVFRFVHRKTGERTPNVEEQKEALNWLAKNEQAKFFAKDVTCLDSVHNIPLMSIEEDDGHKIVTPTTLLNGQSLAHNDEHGFAPTRRLKYMETLESQF